MKILAFGDIHEHIERIAEIKEIPRALCVIITGDLTNVGGIARAKRVIDFVKQFNPEVFAQAGNFDRQEVETYLVETGMRDNYAVIIGGAAPTASFAETIGADAFGNSAAEAVSICRKLMNAPA